MAWSLTEEHKPEAGKKSSSKTGFSYSDNFKNHLVWYKHTCYKIFSNSPITQEQAALTKHKWASLDNKTRAEFNCTPILRRTYFLEEGDVIQWLCGKQPTLQPVERYGWCQMEMELPTKAIIPHKPEAEKKSSSKTGFSYLDNLKQLF